MPIQISNPDSLKIDSAAFQDADFDYDYPRGLDLSPTSDTHKDVLAKILQFVDEASKDISSRHSEWAQIDSSLTAYVHPDVLDEAKRKGDQTSPIIIPSSYAILETLLAYMSATFLQDPIFKYDPTGPEDASGAALLELSIQAQMLKSKVGLNLHTQWRDAYAYGLGVVTPYWDVKRGTRRVNVTTKEEGTGLEIRKIKKERGVLYEGNALNNVDPFLYLPDPMVAAQDIQKARFVAWASKDSKMSLLDEELENDSAIFNAKYLRFINGKSRYVITPRERQDSASSGAGLFTYRTDMDGPVDLVTMYATIIPADWDLGSKESPEKWMFIVAGDQLILAAQPMNLDHDMYPVAVAAPDYDGYSSAPVSRIEMSLGMQLIMDFLFNSHISNVRKAVNDTLIVDPSMINMNDLRSPEPGKIVRTRRSMWGKGITGAVEQLKISDITKGNLVDIAGLAQMMKESTGAVDTISGNVRAGGERRSATEFRDARTGALAKLNKSASIIAMQSMQDLGFMFSSQTQQFMDEDMQVKLTGRWAEDLQKEYGGKTKSVSINDILVATDVTVGSGNIPGGEPTELWIQLMQSMAAQPEIAAQLDFPRIFMHVARQLGATNTLDFMKVSVQSDQAVQDQVRSGELVPVEGE